jgi:hypothetical protein
MVQGLLALAVVAVLALTVAVVILANDEDQVSGVTSSAKASESINYGGFNPATGRPDATPAVQQQSQTPGIRYDGGPEEGTRGGATAVQPQTAPDARYDGGPEEGSRGPQPESNEHPGGPTMIPQGPLSR